MSSREDNGETIFSLCLAGKKEDNGETVAETFREKNWSAGRSSKVCKKSQRIQFLSEFSGKLFWINHVCTLFCKSIKVFTKETGQLYFESLFALKKFV